MRTSPRRVMRFTPTTLESLEARAMLVANVTAQLVGENLKLVGDDLADRVEITQDAAGNYVVSGFADIYDGHLTTVNGQTSVTFTPKTPLPVKIDAKMTDAGDWVQAFGITAQSIKFSAGNGPNVLAVVTSTVRGAVTLTGGDGGGDTTVYGVTAGALAIKTGAGADNVLVTGSTISRGITVDTGTGMDTARVEYGSADRLDVTTGGGAVSSFAYVDNFNTAGAINVTVGAGTGFSAGTVYAGAARSVNVSAGTPGVPAHNEGSVSSMLVNGPITVYASGDAWADLNTATAVSLSTFGYANAGGNTVSGPITVTVGPSPYSHADVYQNTATALTLTSTGDADDVLDGNNISGPIAVKVTGARGVASTNNTGTSLTLQTGSPGNTNFAYAYSQGDDIAGPITISASGGSGSFASAFQSTSTGTMSIRVDGDGAAVYAGFLVAPAVHLQASGGHNFFDAEGSFSGDLTVTSGGPSSTLDFGLNYGPVSVGGTLTATMAGGDNTVFVVAPLTATGTIDGGPGVNTLTGVGNVPPTVKVKNFQNVS